MVHGMGDDDLITKAWFYDDLVTPEKDIIRTENRARIRTAAEHRRKTSSNPNAPFSNDDGDRQRSEEEEEEERGEEVKRTLSDSSASCSFWNQDETCAYLRDREDSPPSEPYYEVDEATLEMMTEVIESYQRRTQSAIQEAGRAEELASAAAKERWALVLEEEKVECGVSELKKRSMNYQQDFSAARNVYIETEASLQRLSKDNAAVQAAQNKRAKEVSQGLATANERRTVTSRRMTTLQHEYEAEIKAKDEIRANRDSRIKEEVRLCKALIADLERNSKAAQMKLQSLALETEDLREECTKTEEALARVNSELKVLRNAQRIEDTVLQAELTVSEMSDPEIKVLTREIINEVDQLQNARL